MKTLHCKWNDDRINSVRLNKLTPMDLHRDNRYLTRDLPRIKEDGLWYPLLVYKADPDWWNNTWVKHRSSRCTYIDPRIASDGFIWAIKMGSNRYQSAVHLGYDAIDIILCNDANECVKLGKWFAQCNPLYGIIRL
jgi:hypothetical protein